MQDTVISDEVNQFELVPQFNSGHYWFCGYPGFNTQIIFYSAESEKLACPSTVQIYDADGFLINEVSISFCGENPGVLDLASLIASCKLESGLKHGHVVVSSPPGVTHQSRILSLRDAWINNIQRIVNRRRELFFPLRFAPDRTSFLAFVNHAEEVSELRVRAFCGSRSPRSDLLVPAMGARIFSLDTLFPEYGYVQDQVLNAYIRIASRSGGATSCFFMDRLLDKADSDIFQTIC